MERTLECGRRPYVIADAAHTLRRVDTGDEALAELEVLVGFDNDLAGEATRVSNRIRGLLTQIHPTLQRVLGLKVHHKAVLELLSRCGGPAGLRKAGRRKLLSIAVTHAPRIGERLIEQIMTALDEQTVTVPGTQAAETILPRLADSLRDVLRQRDQVAKEVERMLDAHPLAPVLTSMPRHRCQDRRPNPARSRRRHRLRHPWPPRRLRRPRPRHPTLRQQHPRRTPTPRRQQTPQTSVLPRRVRSPHRPHQPRLLRPQTRRR